MNHLGDIMVWVEDKRSQKNEPALDEATLIAVEAHVKAIAELLTAQSKEPWGDFSPSKGECSDFQAERKGQNS
jgi:hypothetical protein